MGLQKILKPTKYRAVDTSGNNNHGQIYSGRALEFDGVSDYLTGPSITTGADFMSISKDFTVAFWVKADTLQESLLFSIKQSNEDRVGAMLDETGQIGMSHYDNRTGSSVGYERQNSAVGIIHTGTWYRIVCAWTGEGTATTSDGGSSNANMTFYVNGVSQTGNNSSIISSGLGPSETTLRIGSINTNGDYFAGKMSDFQAWDKKWTQSDVTFDYLNPESLALSNGGTSLTESNLKLWYPMQDGHRGQQSYIMDGANTGLGDELMTSDWDTQFSENNVDSNNTVTYTSSPSARLTTTDGSAIGINDADLVVAGTTYKCIIDITVHSGVGARMQGNATVHQSMATTGTYTFYFNAIDTHFSIYRRTAAASDFTLNSISVQPVNDKHHATTVFYGGEQISAQTDRDFSGVSNWTNGAGANAFNAYNEEDSGKLTVTPDDDGSNIQYAYLDGANWEDAETGIEAMVVGRTYRLSYSLTVSAYTKGTLKIGFANASHSIDTDIVMSFDETSSATTRTMDFVYKGTTDHAEIIIQADTSSVFTASFDDFSIKEVGTATGWTDADQQLDIPQTALQSYNQLAWGSRSATSNASHVTATPSPNFGTADFCISYSVLFNDATDTQRFLSAASSTTVRQLANRLMKIYVSDGDGNQINYTTATQADVFESGKWYHIVENWNYSGGDWANLKVYVNGEYQGISLDLSGLSNVGLNMSGTHKFGSYSAPDHLNGAITEIAYWKGLTFSQDEINELYNNGKILDAREHSAASTYLINYWRNNGLAQWKDLKGSAHSTNNYYSETLLLPAGVDASRDTQGFLMNRQKDTNSLNLIDEDNSYVDVNTYSGLTFGDASNDSAFSVSAWINVPDLSSLPIIAKSKSSNREWVFAFTSNDELSLYLYDENINKYESMKSDSGFAATDQNSWVNVVATYDGTGGAGASGGITLYRNGTALGMTEVSTATYVAMESLAANVRVGSWEATSTYADGQIDDVLIYSKELSADEVDRIYKAGKRSHR